MYHHVVIEAKHRTSLSIIFDESFGVSASNDTNDNLALEDTFAEITQIKSTTPTSSTSDPLRKTTRNSITKKAVKKTTAVLQSKSPVPDSEDEAEKRRQRVRKCRSKKKEKEAEDLLKKEFFIADNTRMEATIAEHEHELAQLNKIVAAHLKAQPEAAAIFSSLFQ